MTEEEKKAIEYLKTRLYGNKGCKYIDVAQEDLRIFIKLVDRLQKENEKLKNIRYDTPYGTETIHLIPESNLIEINTHKYMIEVKPGKFVDLKQVYLENKKLNEYKKNYIPIQEIKDIIEELNRKIDKSIDNSKGGLDEEFIEKAGELLTQKRILLKLLRRKK